MVSTASVELLSPSAFGKALGVSRQAVQQAIRAGRLESSVQKNESSGRWLIDLHAGKKEWEERADPMKRPAGRRKPRGRPPNAARQTQSMFASEEERDLARTRQTLADVSRKRVDADAELKLLDLEERRGRLIDRGEAQREYFRLARMLRDRLLAIPDRLSPSIAALEKPAQVHEALAAELVGALESLITGESPDGAGTLTP